MYKYTVTSVAIAAALLPFCAGAQEDTPESAPILQLSCQGSLQCNGNAEFQRGANGDNVNVAISFEKGRLEKYLERELNKKAFPQDVKNPKFTIASIKAADISADDQIITVVAKFDTVGDLEGSQTVTMNLRNGAAGDIVFPVQQGSLQFDLSGKYKGWPASLIPSVLLGSARSDTEKMVTKILTKNLKKQKLFSYLDAPHSILKNVKLRVKSGKIQLIAALNLPKAGSSCAFAWAEANKLIALEGNAKMTITAEHWTSGVSSTCDVTAAN